MRIVISSLIYLGSIYVNALIDESYERYLELVEWGDVVGRENYY